MASRATPPSSDRPLPSSFDDNDDFYNENGWAKITRKLKEEPLIPFGCALTVAALTNAFVAMRRGDHVKVQKYFRARVAAQGFTVLAIVAGGMYYKDDRHKRKELWKLKKQQEYEERQQKWIKELEFRDEEDKAAAALAEKRRNKVDERTQSIRNAEGKPSVLEAVKAAEANRAVAGEAKGVLKEEAVSSPHPTKK